MSFWTSPVGSVFEGPQDDEPAIEIGFGDRFAPQAGAASDAAVGSASGWLGEAQSYAGSLLTEWDTTKAAFLDVIHSKTSAGLASTERNFQESVARDDSSPLQTYFALTSGVAGGFVTAVSGAITGPTSLVTDPLDTLQRTGDAVVASGIKYAVADTPQRLQMFASGATQISLATAMGGAGIVKEVRAKTAQLEEAASAAAHPPDDALLGSGYYTPRPSKPDMKDGERFGDGSTGAEFFGSAFASRKQLLDRDFSHRMTLSDRDEWTSVVKYPPPYREGVYGHTLLAELSSENLSYRIQNAGVQNAAERFGFGNEMFKSMMRKFESNDRRITSITDHWSRKEGLTTNLNQFLGELSKEVPAEFAAARTFTGRQAAEFGYTDVRVWGNRSGWSDNGVEVTFLQPYWGASEEWANYANAWVRAMGQR